MSAPRRMALAFCCTLFSVALFALLFTIPGALRYGWRSVRPVLQFLPLYLIVAIPGWLLALPFVLHFKDADGRRAWIMLAIGTCIGPAFILLGTLAGSHGRFSWQGDGAGVVMAFWIAFLTTGLYVVLLRRLSPPRLADSSLDR